MTIPRVPFQRLQGAYRRQGPAFAVDLAREYGDLFYARAPLLPPVYYLLRPEHVDRVLRRQRPPLEKPDLIQRVLRASFGDGLFTSRAGRWRRQRRLMQPAFHHGAIGGYAARMVEHASRRLAGWQEGQIVDIGAEMHELTLTIVLDALFSAGATDVDTAVIHRAIRDLGEGLAALSLSLPLFFLPEWVPLPPLRQKRRGERVLARSVRRLIAQRRALGEAQSPPDLLTTLLYARDEATGEGMSDRQLQDELITLYIAGHDTTAVLLAWAWVLLAGQPAAVARLEAELDAALDGRPPGVEDLPRLPYLHAIVQETLRLYPPTAYLFRQAAGGLALDGQRIPDGSLLFLIPYATQRDGRFFAEPDAFRPERWLDGLEKSLPRGAYFPFGLGPRTCIGNGFALMEAQLLLATIARRFRLVPLDEARLGTTATLRFAAPVRMRLQQR